MAGNKGDFYDYATTDPGPIDFGDRLQGRLVWNWELIAALTMDALMWVGLMVGAHRLWVWLK